jgi:hypothetical protein
VIPAKSAFDRRLVGYAGLAAVGLYIASTFVGALLVPGYSHVADSISELTSSTGMQRTPIAWGFIAYNAAFAAMAVGLWRSVSRTPASDAAAALFGVIAGAGVAMVTVAPQDPWGATLTAAGAWHIALAAIAAVGLIAAAFVWSRAFAHDPRWVHLARPSFWFGWTILVLGGAGGALGAFVPELFGVGERVTMVVYLTWFAWISVVSLKSPSDRL